MFVWKLPSVYKAPYQDEQVFLDKFCCSCADGMLLKFSYLTSRTPFFVKTMEVFLVHLMDNLHIRLNFNLSKEKGIKHNS
jgi:hypothetical protein